MQNHIFFDYYKLQHSLLGLFLDIVNDRRSIIGFTKQVYTEWAKKRTVKFFSRHLRKTLTNNRQIWQSVSYNISSGLS